MKLLLRFNSEIIRKPIIAETVLETGVMLEIERAKVESSMGELVVNVPEENCRMVVEHLRKKMVDVTRLDVPITRDEVNCVHCGACVSVCPVGAISYEYDWRVKFDESECVQCGTCVNTCPVGVIKLPEN
ncbi:[Fe-S]-binding protein [Methanocella sp. CWC-04]|uniref:[Fe-S]-binding protein n=1 Tax=Methanooceanicella nereidis TaxID=2052831 RepID=A0AAP2RBJ7_9EURY|nr:4Fe-4S binding protein [Methanocella sp. CWC-04]MCD1294556.1 [Fe-S]-binding protein [Methanocella sp. CWC-04]